MPQISRIRRRRGSTNLIELVSSIAILALLLTALMVLMNKQVSIQQDMQENISQRRDIDFMAEMLQTDIKSANTLEVIDNELILSIVDSLVIYRIRDYVLYRNDEPVLQYVVSGMFVPRDENSAGLYLRLAGGDVIDITFTR